MNPNVRKSWEEFLNPEIMRYRLIAASIYIAGFEALKNSIVSRVRDFFWIGFDESGDKIDPKYQMEVRDQHKSLVLASLNWLKEMNAIDDEDVDTFIRLKDCRNILAHELLSLLGSKGLPTNFEQCFTDMVALFRKIDVWWITNIEMPTNPDFDGTDINEAEIVPGSIMIMQILMDIALGDEKQSKFYYDEFRKRKGDG